MRMKTSKLPNNQADFEKLGFYVDENAAPDDVATRIRSLFLSADYDELKQVRKAHYQHAFQFQEPTLPQPDEQYIASFSISNQLVKTQEIQDLTRNIIVPKIAECMGSPISDKFELRSYKMTKGDVFRMHLDDYIGSVGFIYYLSSRWEWDWGGLLQVLHDGKLYSAIPKYNQLIIINHKLRLPHCVSMITDYALEPRYMLVGILPDQK